MVFTIHSKDNHPQGRGRSGSPASQGVCGVIHKICTIQYNPSSCKNPRFLSPSFSRKTSGILSLLQYFPATSEQAPGSSSRQPVQAQLLFLQRPEEAETGGKKKIPNNLVSRTVFIVFEQMMISCIQVQNCYFHPLNSFKSPVHRQGPERTQRMQLSLNLRAQTYHLAGHQKTDLPPGWILARFSTVQIIAYNSE